MKTDKRTLSREEAIKALQQLNAAQPQSSNKVAQGFAGVPAGLLSAADIPALGYNAVTYGVNKAAELFGRPERADYLPYRGAELGRQIGNRLVGEPETEGEEIARTIGEIGGSFTSPSGLKNLVTAPVAAAKTIGNTALAPARGLSNKVIGTNPQAVEAFREAGVQPTLADVSNSPVVKRVQNIASELPIGSGIVGKSVNTKLEQIENRFGDIIERSAAKTKSEGGEILQKGASNYNKKATEVAGKLYDRAWKNIKPDTKVDMTDTLKVIDDSFDAITPEAKQLLKKAGGADLLEDLSSAIRKYDGKLPLSDVKNIYKGRLENLVNTFGQVGSKDQANLKRVVGAINKDLEKSIGTLDPNALKDLKKADKFWADFSDRSREIANKTIGSNKPVDLFNNTLNSLKKGDVEPYKVLSQRLNTADREALNATFLEKMALKGNEFSGTEFAKNYNKLPKESKAALFNASPDKLKKLDNLVDIIDYGKSTAAAGNPSGTAYTAAIMGLFINPQVALGTAGGTYLAAKAFTNPKVINGLYALSKTKTPEQAVKVFDSYKNVFSKLGVTQLPDPAKEEPKLSREQAIRALQQLNSQQIAP